MFWGVHSAWISLQALAQRPHLHVPNNRWHGYLLCLCMHYNLPYHALVYEYFLLMLCLKRNAPFAFVINNSQNLTNLYCWHWMDHKLPYIWICWKIWNGFWVASYILYLPSVVFWQMVVGRDKITMMPSQKPFVQKECSFGDRTPLKLQHWAKMLSE